MCCVSVLQLWGGGHVPLLLEHVLLQRAVSAGTLAQRAQARLSSQTLICLHPGPRPLYILKSALSQPPDIAPWFIGQNEVDLLGKGEPFLSVNHILGVRVVVTPYLQGSPEVFCLRVLCRVRGKPLLFFFKQRLGLVRLSCCLCSCILWGSLSPGTVCHSWDPPDLTHLTQQQVPCCCLPA